MQTCLVGHPTSPEQEGTDLGEKQEKKMKKTATLTTWKEDERRENFRKSSDLPVPTSTTAIHCNSPRSRLSANAVPAAGRIAYAILWICHLRIVQLICIDVA